MHLSSQRLLKFSGVGRYDVALDQCNPGTLSNVNHISQAAMVEMVENHATELSVNSHYAHQMQRQFYTTYGVNCYTAL